MKKFLNLLSILLLCLVLASCNNTKTDNDASESSYELDNNASESSYELDNNASIIDNSNIITSDISNINSEDVISTLGTNSSVIDNGASIASQNCNCDCCKSNSSLAILIAQTHFFEVFNADPGFKGMYYVFEIINEPNIFVENLEDEYWYIMPIAYENGEPADAIIGVQYVYVIKKSTGEISDLLIFTGE